jgi:TonB family protein
VPPEGGDFYDPRRWEHAYRNLHDVPALLIQLQDDLSRSRRREAFWISVVAHLLLVILVVNADKFEKFLPKRAVIAVSPTDLVRQKELTYLELPPDEQKLTRRPDTNNISDKDRIATSRHPQLDPKELKKILDSSRPGAPGLTAPPAPKPAPPTPPANKGAQQQQQQPQPQQQPPEQQDAQATPPQQHPPSSGQIAKLSTPPMTPPKPSFGSPMAPGQAIEQAARAALANRGGYGGDDGDFGLGQGQQGRAMGQLDVLSDTMGVDFGPYLARVLHDVRQNWYNLIPEVARAPLMKQGKVSIEFAITKDGRIQGLRTVSTSGDIALDRAAYGGIAASNPFPPLPNEFGGQYLALRFHFYYNPDKYALR